jgi:hypothetical protein
MKANINELRAKIMAPIQKIIDSSIKQRPKVNFEN